ncbi:MAG: proline--tRNA ligase [Candidatus Dojkabacteria bacterium]|nr:MAG: proline--tRNA ligase [Candidatus Dojkabacteria bacterium]
MEKIPNISENFADWYQFVTLKTGLADYGPVKGTMIHRPYGFALWKQVQKVLGQMIEADGVEDVYFPLFIPYSFLAAEKEHVEGFAPEVAMITEAGGEKLEEPLVIRPTSETIMYKTFPNWIQSYRDLPLKINQWCNIVRWEKRTVMYMRTSEFLWQEGHTAHATRDGAVEDVLSAATRYEKFLREYMAIPGYKGYKTTGEKFAGADFTVTIESLVKNKKALQICTSHLLGQNFAKAFGITFLDEKNESQHVWQTSWGFSTRTLGGMIGIHGDEKGLVLPPRMAPVQIVIIPIVKSEEDRIAIANYCEGIEKMLKNVGIRTKTDWGNETPGWKFNQWELKGVPLRIEIGIREVEQKQLTVATRLGNKSVIALYSEVYKELNALLDEIQALLLSQAEQLLFENTVDVASEAELVAAMESGKAMYRVFFKDDTERAKTLQEKYKITPRVIPFDTIDQKGPDFMTGEEGTPTIFAKAY